ncbi:hypothetical protein C8Q73DRAFT_785271 [Cubamyces lactineus]|nr:hypothetical protein C8Q73DRAFT_785271 [Cubamyces lactineus]
MSSLAATNATLAGLGFAYDNDSIDSDSSHSSSDESYSSLFSQISAVLVASHDSDVEEAPDEVEENHWHVTYYPESETEINDLEPSLGDPEVSDFIPWPTSPEPTSGAQSIGSQASLRPQPDCRRARLTPTIDRGYEADADSPRARRRQHRRDWHKAPRRQAARYPIPHAQPVIEDLPSLVRIEDSSTSDAPSPSPSPTQNSVTSNTFANGATEGLGLDLPAFDDINSTAEEGEFVDVELEQDIPGRSHMDTSDSDSECDVGSYEYDSDDSDEDHYYDESHLGEYDYDPEDSRVHYLVQHVRPVIEDLPSLEELQARMSATNDEEAQASSSESASPTSEENFYTIEVESPSPIPSGGQEEPFAESSLPYTIPRGVGLGFMFDYPFPPPPPPPHPTPYDGFDTIDLSDDAPPTHTHDIPDSPDLRPHCVVESPSPIVLASPIPCAAFRRFDDLLHHNPWTESSTDFHSTMQVAARQPFAMDLERGDQSA